MVALRLLPTKQLPLPQGRPLRDVTPYYSRSVDRRKEFVLGPKPGILKGLGSLDKKVWEQYQTVLKRQKTPIERAEFYAREMKERRMRSFRALSLLLGEPVNRVGRYIKLLELPEPIKAFLRGHREPKYLRFFSERRLGELARLDARSAWRRFQTMVREADREAGIWRNNGQ